MVAQKGKTWIVILAGPGLFDLMLALFEGKEVEFTIGCDVRVNVHITGLSIEEGSRKVWRLEGSWSRQDRDQDQDRSHSFHGFYDVRTREGWMEYRW